MLTILLLLTVAGLINAILDSKVRTQNLLIGATVFWQRYVRYVRLGRWNFLQLKQLPNARLMVHEPWTRSGLLGDDWLTGMDEGSRRV